MTSLIVDASALVKVLTGEPGADEAQKAMLAARCLFAPDLALVEAFNALRKRWRRGETSRADLDACPTLIRSIPTDIVPIDELFARAASRAAALDHLAYDGVYIVLAEQEAAPLLIADRRMEEAAGRLAGVVTVFVEQ